MLDIRRVFRPSSSCVLRQVACRDEMEAASLVKKSDVNLVIWEREPDTEIQTFIHELYNSVFGPVNLSIAAGLVSEQLMTLFGDDHSPGADRLRDDIITLTEYFLKASRSDLLKLHLRVVDDDACQKFHVDRYSLRLICTYDGPGTEWVPDSLINRKALGTTNEQIVRDVSQIQRMGCFHVGMMKGDLKDCRFGKGVVHRSPPVSETGLKRLVLRLDV